MLIRITYYYCKMIKIRAHHLPNEYIDEFTTTKLNRSLVNSIFVETNT